MTTTSNRPYTTEMLLDIQRFLYDEAATLDERRYHDWIAMLTEDIHYWAPLKRTVLLKDVDEYEIGKPGDTQGAFSIAMGDVNGDGKLDVVVGAQGANDVDVLLGVCAP
jgi:hypothetical protein